MCMKTKNKVKKSGGCGERGAGQPIPLIAGTVIMSLPAQTSGKDPRRSPLYSALHGLPPTLFMTRARDHLLSGKATLHRPFLRAGVDGGLVVFQALPHRMTTNRRRAAIPQASIVPARCRR